MGGDVTLSADQRSNLLLLQKNAALTQKTQTRLSSGQKVSSVTDDAVAYFTAQGLNSRAQDYLEIKDRIDFGMGVISTALGALETIEKICVQMKGIALSAKATESRAERRSLGQQYNDLRDQLDAVAQDAQYLGQNLIGSSPADLTLRLNEAGASQTSELKVSGKTTSSSVLGITEIGDSTNNVTEYSEADWGTAVWPNPPPASGSVPADWVRAAATAQKKEELFKVTFVPPAGTDLTNYNLAPGVPPATYEYYNIGADNTVYGDEMSIWAVHQFAVDYREFVEVGGAQGIEMDADGDQVTDSGALNPAWSVSIHLNTVTGRYWAGSDYMTQIDASIKELDDAITTIRTDAASFGTSMAALKVRGDFTKNYVNTLKDGAGKLTDADINAEGAAMTSLNVRSQLAMQALSFAGRAAQSILSLFR